MNRQWLAVASGLVLGTTLVTSVLAQNSTERARAVLCSATGLAARELIGVAAIG